MHHSAFSPSILALDLTRGTSEIAPVSLALYLHANVLDAPYLSSLIILKAAANQRNIVASVQDADPRWRVYGSSLSRADDGHSVKIKCPPVHCLSGSSCSSPSRTRRFRFFCDSWSTEVLATLRPDTEKKNALFPFSLFLTLTTQSVPS